MFKKVLAFAAMLYAAASFAAVDVNKASAAELDAVNGIGPSASAKILTERKKGDFKDWGDFTTRVKGIKDAKAKKLSAAGLTVNGEAYKGEAPQAADIKSKIAENKAKAKAKEEKTADVAKK
ncbi:MAG: helix-hairpin-helix domain-containing protein [Burkholderiales bacterium]|nr:MAG: helix-hairpin-helix domain-containing protein [Burkholderiales bacterium]